MLRAQGGFPSLPALRDLELRGISILSVPTLLRNTPSPGLARLIIETAWDEYEGDITPELADSLSTGAFATARPHVTIKCISYTEEDKDFIRDLYLAALPTLHREGRLEVAPQTV